MTTRDPVSYTLYTPDGSGDWTLYGVYTLQPVALEDMETLLRSGRVRIDYEYPNAVITSRFMESAVAPSGLTTPPLGDPSPTPAPTPTPSPTPTPPPPPPPGAPTLDFSLSSNSMYIGAI